MTNPSPKLIGTFVLGAIALLIATLLAFGAGNFFRESSSALSFFDSSVLGLAVGAPVAFRGVPVGTVTDIRLTLNRRTLNARRPVYYKLERSRITWTSDPSIAEGDLLGDLIRAGLRARLTVESLVTGQLAIELVMRPGAPMDRVPRASGVTVIPTIPSEIETLKSRLERVQLAELVTSATSTFDQLNQLLGSPTTELLVTLNATLREIDGLVAELRTQFPPILSEVEQTAQATQATLAQARESLHSLEDEADSFTVPLKTTIGAAQAAFQQARMTLASVDELLADDGQTYQNLQSTLEEVEATASSIQSLAETIERNPTMLLRGR